MGGAAKNRIDDAFTPREGPPGQTRLVGDDLTPQQLDELWAGPATGTDPSSSWSWAWWKDKPHQILYRLLCRLTRAEAALETAKEAVGVLREDTESLRAELTALRGADADPGNPCARYCVIWKREQEEAEVYLFSDLREAWLFYDRAQQGWSEVYFTIVAAGPGYRRPWTYGAEWFGTTPEGDGG